MKQGQSIQPRTLALDGAVRSGRSARKIQNLVRGAGLDQLALAAIFLTLCLVALYYLTAAPLPDPLSLEHAAAGLRESGLHLQSRP